MKKVGDDDLYYTLLADNCKGKAMGTKNPSRIIKGKDNPRGVIDKR